VGPEELLGVPSDLQQPDSLLDVVLVRFLVPLDPGPDLRLLLTPRGDVAAVERFLDLSVQLVQVDLVDAVVRSSTMRPSMTSVLPLPSQSTSISLAFEHYDALLSAVDEPTELLFIPFKNRVILTVSTSF
jgi:hypothetical protein